MSNLTAFLAQNALPVENVKYAASKRFLDDGGKPIEWELKAITPADDDVLRKECTKRIPVAGKRNAYTPEIDVMQYMGKLAAKTIIFPNLNDAELQNSYGVMGAEGLLKNMLTPGEYNDLVLKVQEVNGHDTSFEDMVDEGKNS